MSRCAYCRYWFERGNEGDCRKRPPLANRYGETLWPETTSWDWCGEFRARPSKPPIAQLMEGSEGNSSN